MEIAPSLCKGFGRRLQGHRLVDCKPAFVVRLRENRVSLLWRLGARVWPQYLSNEDVLPLTRKELREYIFVSACLGYFYPDLLMHFTL